MVSGVEKKTIQKKYHEHQLFTFPSRKLSIVKHNLLIHYDKYVDYSTVLNKIIVPKSLGVPRGLNLDFRWRKNSN